MSKEFELGYNCAVNEIIDWLEETSFADYISSITDGVGIIRFNAEEFINDLKQHFKEDKD